MGDLSPLHLVIVLAVALVVLGPSRLPEVGTALGRTIREFRQAVSGLAEDVAGSTAAPRSQPAGDATTPTAPGPPPDAPAT